jgi:hypothetical protein
MGIAFNPPLGKSLHLAVDASQRAPVQLCFRASLDSDDELQLKGGAKVQVWSNLPAPERAAGEWGETTFEREEAEEGEEKGHCAAPSTTATAPDTVSGAIQARATALHAYFTVPPSVQTHFAYTYRLVYPSGMVRWLGEYGRNGQLCLDRRVASVALSLAEGWALQPDGSRVWGGAAHGEVAAKIGECTMDGAIHAFGKDGSVRVRFS